MKKTSSGLLVGLHDKLRRVQRHWVAVDRKLPPACPLLLLAGVGRGAFGELAGRLPGLAQGVDAAELELKLARAAYEERKGQVHRWVRDINVWMRAFYRWTPWFALVRRVPGRGQSYQHWWDGAINALNLWKRIVANPPEPLPDGWARPVAFRDGRTVEQFEEVVRAFEAAWWAMFSPEVGLKLAEDELRLAQREATGLLMAYGHGVRARLGQKGALVRGIPQLWPRHKARKVA